MHQLEAHPELTEEVRKESMEEEAAFLCSYCHLGLPTREELINHIKQSHPTS